MKVYIVTKEGFPNGMAATNRIKCYARAIHDGGLDCEVVVCGASEMGGRVRNTEAIGSYEGVPFRYIGGKTIDLRPKYIRLCSQYLKILQAKSYLRRNLQRGDAVLLYLSPRFDLALQFNRLAHKKGAFCVSDLCEYPYSTSEGENTEQLRNKVFQKLFPQLDGIISISDALLEVAKKYSSTDCKHIKVPIMVEFDNYFIQDTSKDVSKPFIFHAGSLSEQKDGVLGMIEAFGMANSQLKSPIEYYLTGQIETSPQYIQIKELIKQYKLEDSVHFVGYLFRDEIKQYLSKASLVISNRPKSKQDLYGFSTKVGEYLATGTPFITTRWGEIVNWLQDGESAYVVEPENCKALASTIVRVFENPDEAKQIGLNGQNVCKQKFDFKNWSGKLVDFFQSLNKTNNF